MCGVLVDVWHHHHNVSGLQGRIRLEGGQQLIVKDFDFSLSAVHRMHDHAEVTFCTHSLGNFRQRPQLENIVLDLVQKRFVLTVGLEQIDPSSVLRQNPGVGRWIIEMI